MNISYMHNILSRIDEIKVMDKNAVIDGVICNVMGMVRTGTEMRLLVLEYDESFQLSLEESEPAESNEPRMIPETNRAMMQRNRKNDIKHPIHPVIKVFIDENEFVVNISEYRRLNMQDWEHLLIIAKFLDNGWQPKAIVDHNIDFLSITCLKLEGEFTSIPAFNQNPELRFEMGHRITVHQVEKPITLIVGENYPDKIMFQDEKTGEEHWALINRVYLADMWEEMEKVFSNPKLQEQVTPDQMNQSRINFEKSFSEICPKGMYLPVIEYECEEDITLDFYSKSFLDAKPKNRGSSMGFILRPEQPAGILGYKLKAAVIQEPVGANTNIIEAEIFQYIHTTLIGDIVLK